MPKQHVHMIVDADVWKLLKIEAAKTDTTMTALVEKLIKSDLGEEEPVLQDQQVSRGDYRGVNLTPVKPIADTGDIVKPFPLPEKKDPTQYQDIKEAYNLAARECSKHEGLPGFKTCRRLDTARKRGIKRLIGELGETTPFEYFKLCCRNRHWCGDNDRGWRADIEFLTRDKQISAALELEEVDALPQVNGGTNGVPREIAIENTKARIRAFINSEDNSPDAEEGFLGEMQAQLARDGIAAEHPNLLKYYLSYTSYRAE